MRITITSDVDTIVIADMVLGMFGVYYMTEGDFTGWYGAPKPREGGVDDPLRDGTIPPARLTSGGRTVSFHGAIDGLSSVETARLRDRFINLMNRWLTLTVEDAAGARHVSGWLSDDPEPTMFGDDLTFTFTLVFFCPDPYKYGDPVSFAAVDGVVSVENDGLLPVYPRVAVRGPVSSWRLAGDSGVVSWSGPSVDAVSVDLRDMIPSSGVMGVAPPLLIPPGVAVLRCSGTGGMALTVTLEPAWR